MAAGRRCVLVLVDCLVEVPALVDFLSVFTLVDCRVAPVLVARLWVLVLVACLLPLVVVRCRVLTVVDCLVPPDWVVLLRTEVFPTLLPADLRFWSDT